MAFGDRSHFFSSPRIIPHPDVFCNPGLVDVFHRVWDGLRVAIRKLVTTAGWLVECKPVACGIEYHPDQIGLTSPRRRPLLPGPLSPHYPTSHGCGAHKS